MAKASKAQDGGSAKEIFGGACMDELGPDWLGMKHQRSGIQSVGRHKLAGDF